MEGWVYPGCFWLHTEIVYSPTNGHQWPVQVLTRQRSLRPGVELATCWLQVRRPNHHTIKLSAELINAVRWRYSCRWHNENPNLSMPWKNTRPAFLAEFCMENYLLSYILCYSRFLISISLLFCSWYLFFCDHRNADLSYCIIKSNRRYGTYVTLYKIVSTLTFTFGAVLAVFINRYRPKVHTLIALFFLLHR